MKTKSSIYGLFLLLTLSTSVLSETNKERYDRLLPEAMRLSDAEIQRKQVEISEEIELMNEKIKETRRRIKLIRDPEHYTRERGQVVSTGKKEYDPHTQEKIDEAEKEFEAHVEKRNRLSEELSDYTWMEVYKESAWNHAKSIVWDLTGIEYGDILDFYEIDSKSLYNVWETESGDMDIWAHKIKQMADAIKVEKARIADGEQQRKEADRIKAEEEREHREAKKAERDAERKRIAEEKDRKRREREEAISKKREEKQRKEEEYVKEQEIDIEQQLEEQSTTRVKEEEEMIKEADARDTQDEINQELVEQLDSVKEAFKGFLK